MDLNEFKPINDRYGHDVGDAALVHFATLLKTRFGADAPVFRMGGDEFVLFLRDVNKTDVPRIKAEVHTLLSDHPLEMGPFKQALQTSIGSATFPNDGKDLDALIKKADVEMFKHKQGIMD